MKLCALVVLVFFCSATCIAQAAKQSDMPYSGSPCTSGGGISPSPQQIEVFKTFDNSFRDALKRNNKAELAFLVHFPLRVNTSKGTILIPDAQSLAGHYDEIFPPFVRDAVLSTTAADYTCRYDEGLGYKAGAVWASTDGYSFGLDAVNTVTKSADSDTWQLAYTCETKTHRIVIDEKDDSLARYRSWNKPKPLSTEPDVNLTNGQKSFEGTGVCSYPMYTFKAGNVTYEVDGALGCTDGSEPKRATGHLLVTIGADKVTDSYCF